MEDNTGAPLPPSDHMNSPHSWSPGRRRGILVAFLVVLALAAYATRPRYTPGQGVQTASAKTPGVFHPSASQMRSHAGTERFAHKTNGAVGWQHSQSNLGGLIQAVLRWRAGAVTITGIFQNEHIERGNRLNVIRIMSAIDGATAVAIQDQHAALRRLPG